MLIMASFLFHDMESVQNGFLYVYAVCILK